MLVTGIEPVRYCYHGILSPGRLPVPPHQLIFDVSYMLSQILLVVNIDKADVNAFFCMLVNFGKNTRENAAALPFLYRQALAFT